MHPSSITTTQLNELLKTPSPDMVVVDVRSELEFNEQRIDHPNVINIDVNYIMSRAGELADKEVYVICRSGGRSGVAQILLKNSNVQATNIEGGMIDWISNNLPTIS